MEGEVGAGGLPAPGWGGMDGRRSGAWLLRGREKPCFVFLDDVRNVTRLVCFPSVTQQASHLIDQPAGPLQGVCKRDTLAGVLLRGAGQGGGTTQEGAGEGPRVQDCW